MERIIISLLIVISCVLCAHGAAAVFYVDPAGIDQVGGGSAEAPFLTIQYALDAASDGDSIIIRPGTYTGAGNYDLTPRGKNLYIHSIDPADPTVVASTIINPSAAGRGFAFVDGESAACTLDGLTITGGRREGSGGAIYCLDSSPTIMRCVLAANTATLHGGAIFLYRSNAVIQQSVITANTANADGGGIEGQHGAFTLVNCLICGNTANGQGAGVDVVSGSADVVNCTIAHNLATYGGGGLYLWGSTGRVKNCIIWGNTGMNGQIGMNPTSAVTVSFSNVQNGYAGEGNIDSDPLFVGLEGSQTSYYDYHLASAWGRYDVLTGQWVHDVVTSPCIDAGDPATDYGVEPWPHGGRVNMGAFGATTQASMNGNPADFNIDGVVDWRDASALAEHWLRDQAGIYNLDGVGRVDMKDVAIFVQHWRWHK
ncbi:MAG TPA: hypothetical protein P5279_02475 [Anaerohalosphaeraceae bacterium]|jgi:hypothetical protein|nr:hypothetical protein [Anaerohalosphaeraceae bacterium]HRT49335.1 hypothetical protein [Anaerohalosphaeraceae bacterium]HRT85936.1 hypothetical protein [Anaerohalosphaeraceae bacterium]